MKNRIAILVGTIGLLIILAIISLAYGLLKHPDKMTALNKLTENAPKLHHLVVLDFDNNGLLDETELMQGHDAIIVVNNPAKSTPEMFNSISALQKLDVNKDGVINSQDPLYRYMALLFVTDHGKGRKYLSFAQAGIKTIKFDQKRLLDPDKLALSVRDNVAGEASLTNGQRYTIRLIAVSVP